MVCRFLSVVLLVTAWALPAGADVDATLVYLLPDSQNRYRPVLDDNGSVTVLADIDSITPPSVAPNGQKVAFAGSVGDESLGRYAIFLVNSNGTGLTQLTDGALAEFDPSWSPDGSQLAVAQNQTGSLTAGSCCRLAKVNVASGQVTGLTSNIGVARPSYSPGGSFILYDTPAGVWRISPSGATPKLIAVGGFDAASSPNEGRVAYLAVNGASMEIRNVPATGGSSTTLYATTRQMERLQWVGDRIYFVEYTGLGYDGRSGVTLRSIHQSGAGLRTERSFSGRVVGVTPGLTQPPSHAVGDVNGDGMDDISVTGPSDRTVLLSDGNDFNDEAWDSLDPRTGWRTHRVGDFDDDGQDDVASYLGGDGTWHVAIAGAGSYSTSVWADFSTASGWSSQLVGDFNGDGRDDIANFHPSNGSWWVSRSTGSGFVTGLWADFSTASGWSSQLVGDFNGDGRDDIANYFPGNGTWWVSRSTGSGFSTSLWADFSTASGWSSQLVGDFNGDGRDDIANFHPSNGSWWVSRSTGSGFVTRLWWP